MIQQLFGFLAYYIPEVICVVLMTTLLLAEASVKDEHIPDAAIQAWVLRRAGVELLDCQFLTGHLASLGAVEIPQERYLELLAAAQSATDGDGAAGDGVGAALAGAAGLPTGFAALLADADAAGVSSSPGNFIAQALIHTS